MPYITQESRESLDMGASPENPGELNYAITKLILGYINDDPSYRRINDVLGALEGAKQEFYRRFAVPYEEKKIAENGDMY